MNTYYIPTSTLNFNDILSTESISPAAFYSMRTFGTKSWVPVDENCIDHIILLYETPKSFSRDGSEREDHPMLIAIQTDEQFPPYSEGILYCAHTLYLDPWHTRFIFFSEEHKRTALSMSDNILDVKLLPLYRNLLETQTYTEKYEKINLTNCNAPSQDRKIEIEKDTNINKLKGLLYGYYVGAYLSVSEDTINCLEAYRKVHADLADSISKENEDSSNTAIAIDVIKKRERQIETSTSNHHLLTAEKSEIVLQEGDIITLKVLDKNILSLFREWAEKVFLKPEYGKTIIPFRNSILNDIINVTNNCGNESMAQQTNKYLTNLQDQFDGIYTNKLTFNSGLLSSLALVLLAGDSWEKLLQVMQRNRLYDYRLPFAIFGCICGFADLYRTFTDYLLDCKNQKYIADVYAEFYGQLFGKSLDTSHQMILDENMPPLNSNGQNHVYSTIIELEQIPEAYRSQYSDALRNIPTALNEADLYSHLSDIWKQLGRNKKSCGVTKKEWEKIISPYKPQKTRSIKKNVSKKSQQTTLPLAEESVMMRQPLKPFYCDENAWDYIAPLIPTNPKVRKTIKEDLMWFQDDYNENRNNTNGGKNLHGRYANKSKYSIDNLSVIVNYQDYLQYNLHNPKIEWKRDLYKKIDIAAIIQKLREVYK